MPGPRIIPLDEPARSASRRLANELDRDARSLASGYPILVVYTIDSNAIARSEKELTSGTAQRERTALVYCHHRIDALRELLTHGIGDVIQDSECTAEVLRARFFRWSQIDGAISQPMVTSSLIGTSEAWLAAVRTVAESAMFSNAPVLLTGPTGTGKELLARLLHTLDPRPRKRDLFVVDCTTLSRDLAGSELFGHERGAFTGAAGEREGAIACADGGTLFLDEIGELPPDVQAQFLRVLQEKAYRRVGSVHWRRADFRLVCATNRDLPAEVEAGRFREDLYHRIAATTCRSPSLAERTEDIARLAAYFVEASGAKPAPQLSSSLEDYLRSRRYTGNVRELRQLVHSCLRRYAGAGPLTLSCLPHEEIQKWRVDAVCQASSIASWRLDHIEDFVRGALRANIGLKELGRLVEAAAVKIALMEADSVTAAATRLGVTPRALHLRKAAEREEKLS